MKCAICNKELEPYFLSKVKGTPIKIKGKIFWICSFCQKKYSYDEQKALVAQR